MSNPMFVLRRVSERRELIRLFNALLPGEEIAHEEVVVRVGLDVQLAGDKNIVYNVREHCRSVLGFIVADRGGKFRRVPDVEVNEVSRKRMQKIHRQTKRGIEETLAIADWDALDNGVKAGLLAKQSVLGAIHGATRPVVINQIASQIHAEHELAAVDPYKVIAAAAQIDQ
jgi:hypothetical protein